MVNIKNHLEYNPTTGLFIWIKKHKPNCVIGSKAGVVNTQGYITISFKGNQYLAHRLAYWYMNGMLPTHQIDHKNRIRTDNKWNNLRAVTNQINSQNSGLKSNNKTGYSGVHFRKDRKKYQVQIMYKNKRICIGHFKDLSDAVKARKDAEIRYGYPVL
jgi:hypothetical protein